MYAIFHLLSKVTMSVAPILLFPQYPIRKYYYLPFVSITTLQKVSEETRNHSFIEKQIFKNRKSNNFFKKTLKTK